MLIAMQHAFGHWIELYDLLETDLFLPLQHALDIRREFCFINVALLKQGIHFQIHFSFGEIDIFSRVFLGGVNRLRDIINSICGRNSSSSIKPSATVGSL